LPDPQDLKRAALDLLSSGNNVHAVTEMLRVPVEDVATWDLQRSDAPFGPPSADASIESTRPPLPARHSDLTDFIPQPPITRMMLIGLPLALVGMALEPDVYAALAQLGLRWLYWLAMLIGTATSMASIVYSLRSGFQLKAHAIMLRGVIGTRELAYVDIDSYRVLSDVKLGIYRVKFTPRSAVRAMEIWLDPAQVQGDVARLLASFRCTGYYIPKFRGSGDSVEQEWKGLLAAAAGGSRLG